MTNFLGSRDFVQNGLRRELFGPVPGDEQVGRALDTAGPVQFASLAESDGPWYDAISSQEILDRDPPARRYGVGVLYPLERPSEPDPDIPGSQVEDSTTQSEAAISDVAEIGKRDTRHTEAGDDDLDLAPANSLRQSALGVSILLDLSDSHPFRIRFTGARYEQINVKVVDHDRIWWRRVPIAIEAELCPRELATSRRSSIRATITSNEGSEPLNVQIKAFSRPHGDSQLVTVSATNKSTVGPNAPTDSRTVFQAHLRVETAAANGKGRTLPYPAVTRATGQDPEAESFDLLYRDAETFAIGHGCAADWELGENAGRAIAVSGVALPFFETPSINPDITDEGGNPIRVSMAQLAGLNPESDGSASLAALLDAYAVWIERLQAQLPSLGLEHRSTAKRHVSVCGAMLTRMRDGVQFLHSDPNAARAFELANHAVLLQQLHSGGKRRDAEFGEGRITFPIPASLPDWRSEERKGYWRAFQIGFLLATVRSVARGDDPDRDVVDLIFFPTGGGKTEAYLGLAAFAIFLRRILNPVDHGVTVLMRYTLRLLTAQQFQRASALICAMEQLRKANKDLGSAFRIGIWLGSSTTPNSRQDALQKLRAMQSGSNENPFLLLRCPWCAAQMGVSSAPPRASKRVSAKYRVAGYANAGDTVRLECPDVACEFSSGLPVTVIDEDIYKEPPSLVIGTVDKFAMLAWRPEARAIFGLDPDGARAVAPPSLIIQDELHLISGPLGSMVGIYEALIEELCTDRRPKTPVRPKIIASTATIRRYEDQVRGLYARDRASLFPPHGFDASDNFFALYARRPDGSLLPGRRFVGIHAPGLGSVQTAQVRTYASLLQGAQDLGPDGRDPYFTLVGFFNSLRELGTSLTLLESDIPDYLKVLRRRAGASWDSVRDLRRIRELTSRLRDDEVPAAMEDLERSSTSGQAVDVCLASSIIEVGIDIDRLSLMTLLGQPKTTSQYIQVTGRIGRKWDERPGLVAVVYSPTKPRDRSHYERFRSYHERLYANVEPTSVTPFATPVLERALHAVLIAYVRQTAPSTATPWPFPSQVAAAAALIRDRVNLVDPGESDAVDALLERRSSQWVQRERTQWGWRAADDPDEMPLMRPAGEWVPDAVRLGSWATPQSMRNVDAECRAEVTSLYALEGSTDA